MNNNQSKYSYHDINGKDGSDSWYSTFLQLFWLTLWETKANWRLKEAKRCLNEVYTESYLFLNLSFLSKIGNFSSNLNFGSSFVRLRKQLCDVFLQTQIQLNTKNRFHSVKLSIQEKMSATYEAPSKVQYFTWNHPINSVQIRCKSI